MSFMVGSGETAWRENVEEGVQVGACGEGAGYARDEAARRKESSVDL